MIDGCRDVTLEPEPLGELERRLVAGRDDRPDRRSAGALASAQASAARQASPAIPCPWTSVAKIQPISGSSPKHGSSARQALNRLTVPTILSSVLRTPPSRRNRAGPTTRPPRRGGARRPRHARRRAELAHDRFIADDGEMGREIGLGVMAQTKTLGLQRGSRACCRVVEGHRRGDLLGLFAEVRPPKRLLKRATWPPMSSMRPDRRSTPDARWGRFPASSCRLPCPTSSASGTSSRRSSGR